jgi:prepilin-type N-terminal cleavage/methylation domain-containing protein
MLVTDFFSDKSRSHGFTLIEIAVVLVIVTLLAIGSLQITTGLLAKQRRDATIARLAAVESAINLFVAQNKFLPCPALGTLDGTAAVPSAQLGREQVKAARAGCNLSNQQSGILPWVTLGLRPYRDAQRRCAA